MLEKYRAILCREAKMSIFDWFQNQHPPFADGTKWYKKFLTFFEILFFCYCDVLVDFDILGGVFITYCDFCRIFM